ncbi:GNAT family N-acetyltransferase [Kribbella lupini]|uniref:GNAT family N-acetyltransferase n=1 Tax=Kribbella lupini TaxID=291602 RepID=A0ABP4M6K9_9ACTN
MTFGIGRFEGEWGEIVRLLEMAFSSPWTEAQVEGVRPLWEPARSFVATDGREVVAHTSAFSLELTAPGARVPVAGVSMVATSPTHRRRGLVRQLMRRQLTELCEGDGEAVAALTASEPVIYGRFGYGLASDHQHVVVPRASRELRRIAGVEDVRIRFADPVESLAVCTDLHNAEVPTRPGMFPLDERWQRVLVVDAHQASPLRCVLAERDGEVIGYAYYRAQRADGGYVEVTRVHARDLAAHVALWQFLLDQDLLSETRYERLPSDDPLLSLLLDVRAAGVKTQDGLWVRLADVGRALAARTYSTEVDVVLGIEDDLLPWNAGSWHLAGGPEGATCEKTGATPDLLLDVRDLGAVYLGRPSLALLGASGLVAEQTSGALGTTSRAFLADRLPWLDTGF